MKKHLTTSRDKWDSWLRKPYDDRGEWLRVCGMIWLWAGFSTWWDLIGKPRDAPFLLIPGHYRAMVWFITGILAIVAGQHAPGSMVRRSAWAGLVIMPTLRAVSYLISWAATWGPVDRLIPDAWIVGDSHAWGSLWIYLFIVWAIRRRAKDDGKACI